jgi:hypothetical protein
MERSRELAELQRHWQPPAELQRGSREVELRGGGIAVTCLAAGLFVGAVAALFGLTRVASRDAGETLSLSASSIETQAIVTRHWRTGGKDSTRRITYEFEYGGQVYHGSVSTPRAIWSGLGVGSPIRIRFVPANPENSHPVDWDRRGMPSWLPALTASSLVLPGLLLLWMIRRQKRLLMDGRPAPAVVLAHRRVKGGQTMKYEFPLLGGGIGDGTGGQSRTPAPVGSTITILYDRDNPKRNAPYPFDMVRVVR